MLYRQSENAVIFSDQNATKVGFISVENTVFVTVGKADDMAGLSREDLNVLCLWLNSKLRGEG